MTLAALALEFKVPVRRLEVRLARDPGAPKPRKQRVGSNPSTSRYVNVYDPVAMRAWFATQSGPQVSERDK